MVIYIIGYLVIIDLFMVSPKVWWTVIKGFVSFGAFPQGEGSKVDWMLLGAFAAYAGSGGLGNVTISNYVRDKGWGMSRLVGAIPSMIGGQKVTLSHLGKVFRITPESLGRFREWWKYNRFEQYYIWVIGCFIGMALPAMLTIAFVPSGQAMSNWSAAAFQADGLAEKGGKIFWYLTLLCGFWVLFSTQLAGVDAVPRRYTDIIWTGFSSVRRWKASNAKWVYYPILALYVNRKFLPAAIQPPLWRQIGLVFCAIFYGIFGTLTVIQKVLVPLLG